ncbi:MAG: methyltransferase domain-containing protein [Betaproteobacteria bacterium]|nr:methyltransferase domain-containing protein [Betaproteobacteria bacterium]
METRNLHEWLASPLGEYLLDAERGLVDEAVANIFGFNAVQIGWPHLDGLHSNRIPFRFTLGKDRGSLRADPCALPLATQSMDLVVLPHALEFAEHPHALLREVDRVMRPEGRLVILGFNPRSLWGMRQLFSLDRRSPPWSGHFLSLSRIKDWLTLLGFEMNSGRFAAYAPPLQSQRWLRRFHFMELAGDRWWGVGGGIYLLQAIKRVHGVRLLTPRWQPQAVVEPALAAAVRASARTSVREDSGNGNVVPLLPRSDKLPPGSPV